MPRTKKLTAEQKANVDYIIDNLIPHLLPFMPEDDDKVYELDLPNGHWRLRAHWFPAETNYPKPPLLELVATCVHATEGKKVHYWLYLSDEPYPVHRGWKVHAWVG